MTKKLAAILSVTVLASVAAACSGGGPAPEPAKSGTTNPQLRQLLQYNRFDPNNDPVGKYLKEKTGYDVKYDMLPVENADEKLNLLMANKEPYDIMKLNANQYAKLSSSGALEPLDDLVRKYGKNMQEAIGPASWNGARLNGKLHAIPEGSSGVATGTALVYRQDWLDELGLKPPTTRDELYAVLKTIKEKKNVIPMTGGKDPFQAEIGSTFGWHYGPGTNWRESDGKIVHMVEDPKTKDYLAFMKKLYTEGLIDAEWAINQPNKLLEKFTSGKAFMFRSGWWDAANLNNALAKNFPNAKIGILPYLTGDSGKAAQVGTGGISWFIAIPKWSPNKEEAMKYLDLKLEKDIFKGLAIGREGVHHEVKDGKYYPILPKFNDEWNFGSDFLTGTDEKNYEAYWQARVRKNEFVQNNYETYQANAKGILYHDALTYAPPIADISKHSQKLQKQAEDAFIKYVTGAESLETYDKFLEQWKASGGSDMIKAANEWYKSSRK
ncbi:extracellular solute-binding protein [Paenibacillus tyrfis]|uniref:ABC transporter substrate-binding protein n=1 Tax=Paenibacillus tyrfis TaxID=1501230 RepID=A0A081P7W4_9BACL|nr:extracellular solute-binding protein [Paenibacillus tyrfis]KEQ26787.1 ABC transporter substrate-binding protein [Paenibacillus tyrfis]